MRNGINAADAEALDMLVNTVAADGAVFIEIGSWKGHSASILGKMALECNGNLICVDHWREDQDTWRLPPTIDCFDTFRSNMGKLGLGSVVHPILTESLMAAKLLKDEIADLVFIDADHRYETTVKDIRNWLPKVKKGGILCGHDCERRYSDLPPDFQYKIDNSLHRDYAEELACHAGVIKAVHDCFGNKASVIKGSKVWMIKKEETIGEKN